MQKFLDAHSGLSISPANIVPKQHIVLREESVCVRMDTHVLKDIEASAKLSPNTIGSATLDQLMSSFLTVHQSLDSHGPVFVKWVPERIAALLEVSGVLNRFLLAQQGPFGAELDKIRSQCDSALLLIDRFPVILAKCREVRLPPRLYDLVPSSSKHEPHMSLFKFLTLSLKNQDPAKYWDDRVARLKDASSTNAKEASDTRLHYDGEVRKCEEARVRLGDCLARSQQVASSAIVDRQCVADASRELEQACNHITLILLSVRFAQTVLVTARKKGIVHLFDSMGGVFMKWRTDLETLDRAPECLDAFLAEVRQRRAYHACLAAFEESVQTQLESARAKEAARRAEFQTRYSSHMPSEFREMLLDPVPTLQIEKKLRRCGIPQLDEREPPLPYDAWLRHNSLDFGRAVPSVCVSEVQTSFPDVRDASSGADVKAAAVDAGTDPLQLQDDPALLAERSALEEQEKARLDQQQAALRSQFDAEVSGYQMQLSEVERAKDTQLVIQTTVVLSMLDMLELPDDFPGFPDVGSETAGSSCRSQFEHFLSAFQSHVELKNRQQEAVRREKSAMQAQVDELKKQLDGLRGDLLHFQQLSSSSQHTSMASMTPRALYADATSPSEDQSPLDEELQSLRLREEGHRIFCAEMEDRLRLALRVEEEAKRERAQAMEQVAELQQQMQAIMQELRQQHERQVPPLPAASRAHASPSAGGGATYAQIVQPHDAAAAEAATPKHIETDSLLAKLLDMGYEPQAAADTIAAMSKQGNVPTLDEIVERMLNP